MGEHDTATILVVDDEPGLADGHAARLQEHDVRTAYDGREALDALDEAVDIVFLDRRMPGLSGDEVLETVRERGVNCRIVMLTGVEPSVDIVSMGFDEYLKKPVGKSELQNAVKRMLRRSDYDAKLQEYFSLAAKRATLETESAADVECTQEYDELCRRLEAIERELDEALENLPDDDGYVVAANGRGRTDRATD
jgi:DNA-binding response OmpR family regulator